MLESNNVYNRKEMYHVNASHRRHSSNIPENIYRLATQQLRHLSGELWKYTRSRRKAGMNSYNPYKLSDQLNVW